MLRIFYLDMISNVSTYYKILSKIQFTFSEKVQGVWKTTTTLLHTVTVFVTYHMRYTTTGGEVVSDLQG